MTTHAMCKRCDSASDPCIDCMRSELKKAGWTERNLTTYIDTNGAWYRGPYGAWKEMKRRQSQDVAD
jgi:hypothetical protein